MLKIAALVTLCTLKTLVFLMLLAMISGFSAKSILQSYLEIVGILELGTLTYCTPSQTYH